VLCSEDVTLIRVPREEDERECKGWVECCELEEADERVTSNAYGAGQSSSSILGHHYRRFFSDTTTAGETYLHVQDASRFEQAL
jgi:hypothetical protein